MVRAATVRIRARPPDIQMAVFARHSLSPVLGFGRTRGKDRPAPENDRKAEADSIRRFASRLIEEGKAKEFLVKHGFVTPTGRLTKRYGG